MLSNKPYYCPHCKEYKNESEVFVHPRALFLACKCYRPVIINKGEDYSNLSTEFKLG